MRSWLQAGVVQAHGPEVAWKWPNLTRSPDAAQKRRAAGSLRHLNDGYGIPVLSVHGQTVLA
jgi:hypothetical protein